MVTSSVFLVMRSFVVAQFLVMKHEGDHNDTDGANQNYSLQWQANFSCIIPYHLLILGITTSLLRGVTEEPKNCVKSVYETLNPLRDAEPRNVHPKSKLSIRKADSNHNAQRPCPIVISVLILIPLKSLNGSP